MPYRVEPSQCPVCETFLDAATGINDHAAIPQPGDITVCLYCTSILEYNNAMSLVTVNRDEIEPEVLSLIDMAIASIQQSRQGKLN